jgi:hypothetical protein
MRLLFTALAFLLLCTFSSCTSKYYLIYSSDVDPFVIPFSVNSFDNYFLRTNDSSPDPVTENKLLYILRLELEKQGKTQSTTQQGADIIFEVSFDNNSVEKTVPTRVVTDRVKYYDDQGRVKYRNVYGASTKSVTEITHHLILTVSQKNKAIININCYDHDWDYETIARFLFPCIMRHFGVDGEFKERGAYDKRVNQSGYLEYDIYPSSWERED